MWVFHSYDPHLLLSFSHLIVYPNMVYNIQLYKISCQLMHPPWNEKRKDFTRLALFDRTKQLKHGVNRGSLGGSRLLLYR